MKNKKCNKTKPHSLHFCENKALFSYLMKILDLQLYKLYFSIITPPLFYILYLWDYFIYEIETVAVPFAFAWNLTTVITPFHTFPDGIVLSNVKVNTPFACESMVIPVLGITPVLVSGAYV